MALQSITMAKSFEHIVSALNTLRQIIEIHRTLNLHRRSS